MNEANPKEEIIQSTLRLPRPLWEQINHIAVDKRLSMAQAVIQAITEYCKRETLIHVAVRYQGRKKGGK
jgi:predicted DNA-binding ribbon-helix-helix protein